jgi:hypothetical protein
MRFFGPRRARRLATSAAAPPPVLALTAGAEIAVSQTPAQVREVLEDLLAAGRPRQYPQLPRVVPAGWVWLGASHEHPAVGYAGVDAGSRPVFVALKDQGGATQCRLFPGDPSRGDPLPELLDQFRQRVAVVSEAPVPPGVVGLTAPPISDSLVEDVITSTARTLSPATRTAVGEMFLTQIKFKAAQIIQNGQDHARAVEYLDAWATLRGGSLVAARAVLDDLCRWDPTVTAYLQDWPLRMRAILIQAAAQPGTFWDQLP